jgi:hypothetical protein
MIVVTVPIAIAAGLHDTASEQPSGDQQCDHRHKLGAHVSLSSISGLVAIRGIRILAALLPPTVFFPTPMLCPAFVLALAFTRLPTTFPATRSAPIPIPLGLLNGGRLPDRRWKRKGMSGSRSHNSHYQRAKNSKASHDVAHSITSTEEDGDALWQRLG